MSNALKFVLVLVLLFPWLAAESAAQTPNTDELRKQIELSKLQTELAEQEIKKTERLIELERQKQELARLQQLAERPARSNVVTPAMSAAPDSSRTDPQAVTPSSPAHSRPTPDTLTQAEASGGSSSTSNSTQPLLGGSPSPSVLPQADNCTTNALDPASATRYKVAICRIIDRILEQEINGVPSNQLSTNNTKQYLSEMLAARLSADPVVKSFFLDSEKKRTDKQVGAAPDAAGTTSLVVKGGTPALIGWAVEQGAATSSTSGNTVTVRVNPFNLGKAVFLRQGLLQIREPSDDNFERFLRKLSVGVSFDSTRGAPSAAFTGQSGQVSAVSVRYEFINNRNPLSPKHKTLREKFFFGQTANFDRVSQAIGAIFDRRTGQFRFDSLNDWLAETNARLSTIPSTARGAERRLLIKTIVDEQVEKIPYDQLGKVADLRTAIDSFADGTIGFKAARDDLLEEINDGQVASFEYTNNREPVAPDTSNFRFIWEKGFYKRTDFTFNGSLTIYNKQPILGVRRIRDFQLAIQTDTKLAALAGGDILLSFAGRYERLNGDTVDPQGIVIPGTKGDIAFGQAKLTIPIADWGVKLPLSITFANRTELIKESNVRANFGFTFDLDPIFARLKPF